MPWAVKSFSCPTVYSVSGSPYRTKQGGTKITSPPVSRDDELHTLEDMVADFIEFEASLVGVATLDAMSADENAGKLRKLIALSEHLAADAAFARQARRKYV